MKHKFIHILGINHLRMVGVAKSDGKAYDFYIMNYKGYRPPQDDEELKQCIDRAKRYYDDCELFGICSPFEGSNSCGSRIRDSNRYFPRDLLPSQLHFLDCFLLHSEALAQENVQRKVC